MIFLHTSVVSTVVVDSIVSSNLVRSPTYGKTFPALHSLEDYDGKKVIAIGSSIMQYSIDGNLNFIFSTPLLFSLFVNGKSSCTGL